MNDICRENIGNIQNQNEWEKIADFYVHYTTNLPVKIQKIQTCCKIFGINKLELIFQKI